MEECINKCMGSLNAKINDVGRALSARINTAAGRIEDTSRRVEDNRCIDETNKR
ncbi:hypothetical protein [Caldivirga sp. UBA161]|uniref:hypothetical protein n=1 Tax=Caldivirga sp. UBA161 TaxID=1915569 RepID=UPI0025BF34B7|nr:hypothetical protein [Caldivirga sp. UBA161]